MKATSILREIKYRFFSVKNPRPNVGMQGDLDDVDLLIAVEQEIGVQFSDEAAEAVRNVGQFFDLTSLMAAATGHEPSWQDFVTFVAPFGTMPAEIITPETEFFEHKN